MSTSQATNQASNHRRAPFPMKSLLNNKIGSDANLSDQQFLSIIPASYRSQNDDLVLPRLDNAGWIEHELDLERLHRIRRWIWVVGRPTPPRPLHRQVLLGREIFVIEQMDMHLVWTAGRMYLKPFPRFLLEPHFWIRFLACDPDCACVAQSNSRVKPLLQMQKPESPVECRQRKLLKIGLGFLFSYVALIRHESDLIIAKENHLLPVDVDWAFWTALVRELDPEHIYPDIDERFLYGELRLSRLNKIFKLTQRPLLRGYMSRWQHYGGFFQEYFGLLAGVTVYVAIILTAMQVGLATVELGGNNAFSRACYGFTVLSILSPLIVVTLILLIFLCLFVSNWYATVSFGRKRLEAISTVCPNDEKLLPAK